MNISLAQARRMAVRAQGLDGGWELPSGAEGAAQVVERLGYVQIDTIAVVERAHHHTLWARQPDYTPALLDNLQARERRVFEYWAHAAAYVPMRDYRFYLRKMRSYAEREQVWLGEHREVVEGVLGRIRAEGALGAADFEAPEGWVRRGWWSWKPAKQALERLFAAGELMVSERRAFQRRYDLRERVLPPWVDVSLPDEDEQARYAARQALQAYGVVIPKTIRPAFVSAPALAGAMRELAESGEAVAVEIEGLGSGYYAHPRALASADAPLPKPATAAILSPFDNAVIWRKRVEQLFGFKYSIECYTPQEKRRYGYFTLPVLWGECFMGRLDAKAERKTGVLIVRQLHLEPDAAVGEDFYSALAARLRAFAAFNGCGQITLDNAEDGAAQAALARALENS